MAQDIKGTNPTLTVTTQSEQTPQSIPRSNTLNSLSSPLTPADSQSSAATKTATRDDDEPAKDLLDLKKSKENVQEKVTKYIKQLDEEKEYKKYEDYDTHVNTAEDFLIQKDYLSAVACYRKLSSTMTLTYYDQFKLAAALSQLALIEEEEEEEEEIPEDQLEGKKTYKEQAEAAFELALKMASEEIGISGGGTGLDFDPEILKDIGDEYLGDDKRAANDELAMIFYKEYVAYNAAYIPDCIEYAKDILDNSKKNEFENAETILKFVLELDSKNTEAIYLLACLYMKSELYDEAIDEFELLTSLYQEKREPHSLYFSPYLYHGVAIYENVKKAIRKLAPFKPLTEIQKMLENIVFLHSQALQSCTYYLNKTKIIHEKIPKKLKKLFSTQSKMMMYMLGVLHNKNKALSEQTIVALKTILQPFINNCIQNITFIAKTRNHLEKNPEILKHLEEIVRTLQKKYHENGIAHVFSRCANEIYLQNSTVLAREKKSALPSPIPMLPRAWPTKDNENTDFSPFRTKHLMFSSSEIKHSNPAQIQATTPPAQELSGIQGTIYDKTLPENNSNEHEIADEDQADRIGLHTGSNHGSS